MTTETVLPELRKASTPSGSVGFRSAGTGFPCVLLHGIGGNSECWREQFGPLGTSFRAIAWDAPGYGGSEGLAPPRPTTEDYARALNDLLDVLVVPQCVLIGHSLGALIAACFAATYPMRVRKLVLADAASGHALLPDAVRLGKLEGRLQPLEHMSVEDYAAERVANLLSAAAPPATRQRACSLLAKIRMPGYRQAATMLSNGNIFADLARVHAPVRVICGADDRVTTPESNRAIADAVPGSDFVLIAGGHLTYLENPAGFNEAVMRFVSELANEG